MNSVGLHGRLLSYMLESAGLHGGIGYMVGSVGLHDRVFSYMLVCWVT